MEKTKKQKQWEDFKSDLLVGMDLDYKEVLRILNTKNKYLETKTMEKCMKHIRNIIHDHKILMRDSSAIKSANFNKNPKDIENAHALEVKDA